MPLNSVYKISDPTLTIDSFTASISFDPRHEVFSGHFPGQPVVPGVVLVRIVRDVVSQITGRTISLQQAPNIKFLNIIDPGEMQNLSLKGTLQQDEESNLAVNASLSSGETIFFRFKGTFS